MQTRPLSVAQINEYIRMLMESDAVLSEVTVAGEISNYTESRAGHIYFTLKDADGQLRAVMFRGAATRLSFRPCDGMRVIAYGRISVYAPMGQYQMYVEALRADGEGALAAQFERLRRTLEAEGLFDAQRKRPLPAFPERIGVITSPYGAAVRDLIRILGRRYPAAEVRLFPSLVQGVDAPEQLRAGLRFFEAMTDAPVDLIILGRGGGSAEDLWAFNDEALVRAVAACKIPVISAVGHENDYTLCDYAADLRASTPSAAAELAVPDRGELLRALEERDERLSAALLRKTGDARQRLAMLTGHGVFAHPERMLELRRERADRASDALAASMARCLERNGRHLQESVGRLEALSPLAVMRRGYAALWKETGAVTTVGQISVGDRLHMRLSDGTVSSTVTAVHLIEEGE